MSDHLVALKRNDSKRLGATLQNLGSMGYAGGGALASAEVERSRLEARLEQEQHCPECGSTDYDQAETKLDRRRDMDKVARLKQYVREQKAQGRKVSWAQANEELDALDRSASIAATDAVQDALAAIRLCPYCAEEIKAAAVKCKHCGSAVEAIAAKPLETPTPNQMVPGWYPDPYSRHEHRYWDGASWTSHVSDAGTTAQDPI